MMVQLAVEGRGGPFKWDSSVLSAQVMADPLSGVYVAPTSDLTGASGAWVRSERTPVQTQWFNNGDANTAINAALFLVHSFGGGTVVNDIAAGLISNDLHIYPNTTLDLGHSVLTATVDLGAYFVLRNHNVDQPMYTGDSKIIIKNGTIDLAGTSAGGIGMAHVSDIVISNVRIINGASNLHAIDLPAVKNVLIEKCYISGFTGATSIQIDQASTGSLPLKTAPQMLVDDTISTEIRIIGNKITNGSQAAIHLHKDGHNDIIIAHNTIEACAVGITDDAIYTIGHARVIISGNTIDGRLSPSGFGHGITLYSGIMGGSIIGNTISGNDTNGIGIYIADDSGRFHENLTISGNSIRAQNNNAIVLQKIKRSTIAANTITDYGENRSGISIADSNTISISNNIVATTSQVGTTGIMVKDSDVVTVQGNTATSGSQGIVVENTGAAVAVFKNVTISGNVVNSPQGYGIAILGALGTAKFESINISTNSIRTPGGSAIYLQYVDWASISANTVTEPATGTRGIYGLNASALTVVGNVVVAKTTTPLIGIEVDGTGYDVISSNRIRGATTGIKTTSGDYRVVSGNIITAFSTSTSLIGENNQVANNITP